MTELSVSEMKAKIAQVDKDIEQLRLTGESGRRLEVLCEYREYLKDELDFVLREKRQGN